MPLEFRTEQDSMGEMHVPATSYYGAQTARALENFPISKMRFPREFIRALGLIKKHAAIANRDLGLLPGELCDPIVAAAQEVANGNLDSEFVLDIFQTGSGTSTNMNANEVIANRAIELLGGRRGDKSVHPNDHVNRGQSSNDVIPSAIQVAAADGLMHDLLPEVNRLAQTLNNTAAKFDGVLKIGRTHLQDATPVRLGQEFSGYAAQTRNAAARIEQAVHVLGDLPLGGTAVGTGINTHPNFAAGTIRSLATEMRLDLREASNHFAAQGSIDALVTASGALRSLALALVKIANDVRWLGSGPRCGIGELRLPAVQPGSSSMPGKVNPVMCEMLIQVSGQVIGNDAAIAFAATCGAFELNTMLPVAGHNLLESIRILSSGCRIFREKCIEGIEADERVCESYIERSLAMCTALVPEIGYDRAAAIAKEAYQTGRTVREVARERSGLDEAALTRLLDPARQAGPPAPGGDYSAA